MKLLAESKRASESNFAFIRLSSRLRERGKKTVRPDGLENGPKTLAAEAFLLREGSSLFPPAFRDPCFLLVATQFFSSPPPSRIRI